MEIELRAVVISHWAERGPELLERIRDHSGELHPSARQTEVTHSPNSWHRASDSQRLRLRSISYARRATPL